MIDSHTPKTSENAPEELTRALREELLEYAGLLELLQRQQALICEENLLELIIISDEISSQQQIAQSSRHTRTYWQKRTVQAMHEDDLPWDQMALRLPVRNQVPLQLIRIEINSLLDQIQVLLGQNQYLSRRATSPFD